MCVARLLEAEAEYVELSRRLYEDPGAALAREMDGLRGSISKKFMKREDIAQHLIDAREQFAQGQLREGYQPLLIVINLLVLAEIDPACRQILLESGTRMHEFGLDRMEYLILAIVVMEKCIK